MSTHADSPRPGADKDTAAPAKARECLLKVNPAATDQRQRPHCDYDPQKNPLQQRPNADLLKRLLREARSNQEERDRQADDAEMLEIWIEHLERMYVGIGHCRQTKEQDEAGPLNARLALLGHGGSDRQRHNP